MEGIIKKATLEFGIQESLEILRRNWTYSVSHMR
jgi:hypothetical protein